MTEPVPFEVYEEGVYLHGTRAVNVADQRLPGKPTRSYRTLDPVRVMRNLKNWPRRSEENGGVMPEGLRELRRTGGISHDSWPRRL